MKLHILAFAAHPDDAELSCSGILHSHKLQGKSVGVVDLTQGELGTRGSAESRNREAAASTAVLGLDVRNNLKMADGFFANDMTHQLKVIAAIRQYQPDIVLLNAPHDRHPDHGRAAQLVRESCFLSGLAKVSTHDGNGLLQLPWRPKRVFHYIQDTFIEPHIIIDISASWEAKLASICAFHTQFYNPQATGNDTYISGEGFLKNIEARAQLLGKRIGVKYGEGLLVSEASLGLTSLFDLVLPDIS